MGSGGTQWEVADVVSASRMNQKTLFVGTGAQIAALGTTYAGQMAMCTETAGSFLKDSMYFRTAANGFWLKLKEYSTFFDDFSGTDDWTDSNSSIIGVNTGTDVMDYQEADGDLDEVTYIDIGALGADAEFILRMKFNIAAFTQSGTSSSNRIIFGLSSANDIAAETTRDEVGVIWRLTGTGASINKFYAFTADGAALPLSGTDFSTATPSTTGGDGSGNYYLKITGDGAGNYTFSIYSDSSYSTLIESETIADAGITGLRYIVIRSVSFDTAGNTMSGTVDDVQFSIEI